MADGVTIISNRFPEIIAALPAKAEQGVADTAQKIASDAASKAPHDTGALASSISASSTGKAHWTVTAGVRYAAYVEYGTAEHGGPQPFLTPAAHENEPNLLTTIAQAIGG